MTENLVQFPTKAVRDWATLERSLRPAFLEAGLSEAAEDRLLQVMKEFYEGVLSADLDLTIPAFSVEHANPETLAAAIKAHFSAALEEQLHAFTNRLFIDRLKREMDFIHELGL